MVIVFIILYFLFLIVIWTLLRASSIADDILEKENLKTKTIESRNVNISD